MLIEYWDCKYSGADEVNVGTEESPDYDWVYYCNHPQSTGRCPIDKYEEDDCKLLDYAEQDILGNIALDNCK